MQQEIAQNNSWHFKKHGCGGEREWKQEEEDEEQQQGVDKNAGGSHL